MRRTLILVASVATIAPAFVSPSSDCPNEVARTCAHPSPTPTNTSVGPGRVITDLGGDDEIHAVALQSDGKIVVAGASETGQTDFALARYLPTGALDPSFGDGGKVITDLGGLNDFAFALAVQADGKIVVAGMTDTARGGEDLAFALARYRPTGSLDPTFGHGGVVITQFRSRLDEYASALAIQPDGKIVVAGGTVWPGYQPGGSDFALARYTPRGSLDRTFGRSGKVITAFHPGLDADVRAMALQGDGKIVVAGTEGAHPASLSNSNSVIDHDLALVRYTSTGSLDARFGHGGRVIADLGSDDDAARNVAIQADGKIVVVEETSSPKRERVHSALARYTTTGTLDSSFGGGRPVPSGGGLAIQPDGKIIAGASYAGNPERSVFALARYTPTGSLDPSFGEGGRVTTHFGSHDANVRAIAVQPDGKVVVAGDIDEDTFPIDVALARYTPTGTLDSSFGGEASPSASPTLRAGPSPSREHASSWARGTLYGSLAFFALLVLASAFVLVQRRKASALPGDQGR